MPYTYALVVSIIFHTTDGAGGDFLFILLSIIFHAGGVMQQCLPPSVMTDMILETNETFSLVLTSSDNAVILEPFSITTITIVDDGSM